MAATIILFVSRGGALTVQGSTPNDPFLIEEVSIKSGGATGRIRCRIEIPTDPPAPGSSKTSFLVANGKLKTWGQIQGEIKQLRDIAKFDAAVAYEAERDALIAAISNVK